MDVIRCCCVLGMMFVAACSPGMRPYDGVIGYQVVDHSATALRLIYTDEADYSPPVYDKHLRQSCARELQLDTRKVAVSVTQRIELTQLIPMPVQIPVGDIHTLAKEGNNTRLGPVEVHSRDTVNIASQRVIKLIRFSADCHASEN